MARRRSMAACLIVMLATLSLSGLGWHRSNQAMNVARRLAEGQAADQAKTIELLTQSHMADAEILEQLRTMAKAAQSTQPQLVPRQIQARAGIQRRLSRSRVSGRAGKGLGKTADRIQLASHPPRVGFRRPSRFRRGSARRLVVRAFHVLGRRA